MTMPKISGISGLRAELDAASDRIHILGVSPKDFGAAGDGLLADGSPNPSATNDIAAVNACLTWALDRGYPVYDEVHQFAVSGDITISNRIRPNVSLRLRQLSPTATRKTLSFIDCEKIRGECEVDIGTAKAVGSMDQAFGIRVIGGSGHKFRATATGDGKVTYVQFWRTTDSEFFAYVHDGEFDDAAASDDVVQGIAFADNVGSKLYPTVKNLTGNATYFTQSGWTGDPATSVKKLFPNLRTRGIAGGGNVDCTVVVPEIDNVDQAIDFSGNGGGWGNRNLQIFFGHTTNCGSVGVKLSGVPNECRVIGHVSRNAGMANFIVRGGDQPGILAEDNELFGCTGINPGYNDIHHDTDLDPSVHTALFCDGEGGGAFVAGTRAVGLKAIDKQGFYVVGDDPYYLGAPLGATWPGAGATTAIMTEPWTGYTGDYSATFKTTAGNETKTVTLTAGSTTITWTGGLTGDVTHPFVSRPAAMTHGAYNWAAYTDERPNELIDFKSEGHTIAAEKGFQRDVCHITASGSLAAAHNTNTAVTFDVEVDDTSLMHDPATPDRIYPKRPGVYRVRGMIPWVANATGYRRVEVKKLGGAATQFTLAFAPVSGELTVCPFDCEFNITAADIAANAYFHLTGEQTSGAALDIRAERWMKVERIRPL